MLFIYGDGDYTNYRRGLESLGQRVLIGRDGGLASLCGGLVLPGGGDIGDGLSDGEAGVIRYFIEAGRPILGICRGMQALNVYFGGTLFAHIPGHRIPAGDATHPTRAIGLAAALLGPEPTVNSNHHQAIDRLGDGLRPCQWAADGVIEAVAHEELPIFGVQYHPERMGPAGEPVLQWICGRVTG